MINSDVEILLNLEFYRSNFDDVDKVQNHNIDETKRYRYRMRLTKEFFLDGASIEPSIGHLQRVVENCIKQELDT